MFRLGLVSAAPPFLGLVAIAPAATAAPYHTNIATVCSASANARVVKVRVRADGTRNPKGTATIRISNGGDVVRTTPVSFSGGDFRRKVLGNPLRKGRHTVTVKANPRSDTYKNCSQSFGVRVR